MITEDLYDKVLVEPARKAANKLSIVSGYASGAFAADHLADMLAMPSRPIVHLIVGMFPQIGFLRSHHRAFQQLSITDYPLGFECRYIVTPPPVHVKAYAWYKQGQPLCGFVGSANYSANGFKQQREAVTLADAQDVQNYFDNLWDGALDCREPEADRLVAKALANYRPKPTQAIITEDEASEEELAGLQKVSLSLLAENGEIHNAGAGLNWGQPVPHRPNREPNQAYISVPSAIGRSGFFPPLKQHFLLTTDDGKLMLCVPAQPKKAGGTIPHAIHTPENNSLLGIYFRNRLGLASGAPVTKQDLLNYGRTDVVISKIADDDYFMDFSKP